MKITLRPHLKIRLKQRLIPDSYPKTIISQSKSRYFDTETKHLIAIKELFYAQKLRPMVACYDIIDSEVQVITVYPTDDHEIKNRVKNKRWIKNE